jgi:hypothetical protein
MSLSILLLLIAVILFFIDAARISAGRVNLVSLALALFALSFLVDAL